MKNINLESHVSPWLLDLFCIGIILALNPICYFICFSPGIMYPDTFAYATMARDLFNNGLLYIPSWGHVDQSLILPPLYPFLIACGRFFSNETLTVAEYVSSISMLAFTFPIYLFMKKYTNRIVAITSICLIQINYYYFLIGMSPLSESVFLATLGFTLLLTSLFSINPFKKQQALSFFFGISCSLIFLSRQIGIIIYAFVGIALMLSYVAVSGNDRKTLGKNILFTLCGALIFLIPYTVSLYFQTGQHPLTQNFKKFEYVIKVSDPEILHDVSQEKNLRSELLDYIKTQPNNAYTKTYAERRRMRKLLPDASEMYGNVLVAGNKTKTDRNLKTALSNFTNPKAYFIKVYNNIINLKTVLGWPTIVLFFIFCVLPLFIKPDQTKDFRIFLLPALIIFYLLILSLLTSIISRYAYILFPFCIMHIFIMLFKYMNRFLGAPKTKLLQTLIYIIVFSSILISTPMFFTDLNLSRKFTGMETEYGSTFKKIINGDTVFSLAAYEAYMVGSPYRILPNDSLDKVASYGKKTGIRWLLVFQSRSNAGELQLYNNVDWYSIPLLEKNYNDLVRLHMRTADGTMALFEFL